jgi:putative ABC transport system permease protein
VPDGGTMSYQGKNSNAQVLGVPDDYFKVKEDVPFNFGRKPNPLDQDENRKVVVIGTTVADRLFDKGVDPIGKDIRVKDVVMKVAGVFYDKGDRGQNSERVLMPLTTMERIYGGGEITDNIWVRPESGVDAFDLEKKVLALLKRRHDVAPDDNRGIASFNMAEPMKRVTGLFIGIDVFIWFVGLGTLTAGIVGISNIMIITVKERTKEIGIRKALGATPFHIVSTLLLESTLVTGVAGYLGLVIGVALLEFVAFGIRSTGAKLPYFVNPGVDFRLAITALLLLVGVGVLAGLMPALRAARITPTEAMKSE